MSYSQTHNRVPFPDPCTAAPCCHSHCVRKHAGISVTVVSPSLSVPGLCVGACGLGELLQARG